MRPMEDAMIWTLKTRPACPILKAAGEREGFGLAYDRSKWYL